MHEGHRRRLINKLLQGGSLPEHELAEAMLFNVYPRRDVNKVAHDMIAAFGGLRGILRASEEEIEEIDEVGEGVAEYIYCLGRSLDQCDRNAFFGLAKSTDQFRYLLMSAGGMEGELLLYLTDADGRVRRIYPFRCDRVTKDVLCPILNVTSAYGVFAARVRSGAFPPDETDERVYTEVRAACTACGVRLFDFCLYIGGEILSYFVTGRTDGDRF